jgi:Ca2+-binding EF-hand superfamily protein
VIGLSAILEGEESFAKFVFEMFDEDGSGVLLPDEVENFTRVCGFKLVFECKVRILSI